MSSDKPLDLNSIGLKMRQLLSENGTIFSPVVGAFIFLPLLLIFFVISQMNVDWASQDEAKLQAELLAAFSAQWWSFALVFLSVTIGSLTLNILALDDSKPTVGGAIIQSVKLLPFYFAATLIMQLPLQIVSAGLNIIGPVGSFISTLITLFVAIRFMPYVPILGRGLKRNPLGVLKDAWDLTTGYFAKLLLFSLLVAAVSLVIGLVFFAFSSLIFALVLPAAAASFMMLLVSALLISILQLITALAGIAIYRELVKLKSQ